LNQFIAVSLATQQKNNQLKYENNHSIFQFVLPNKKSINSIKKSTRLFSC